MRLYELIQQYNYCEEQAAFAHALLKACSYKVNHEGLTVVLNLVWIIHNMAIM